MPHPSLPRWRELAASLVGRRAGRREVVDVLVATLAARHVVTCDHVKRVAVYSTGLATALGLSAKDGDALRVAALLHDIGKVAIPDHILLKPGRLTPDEFNLMKMHPITGAEILRGAKFHLPVLPLVRWHHERYDGKGYPDGLTGDTLPIAAQVLALCDFYDALREDRTYRPALTREHACELVREGSGHHFAPRLVEAFLKVLPELERSVSEQAVECEGVEVLSARARLVAPAAGFDKTSAPLGSSRFKDV